MSNNFYSGMKGPEAIDMLNSLWDNGAAAITAATNASASATAASTSATNAATSATNAANSYDAFDDRYLGSKATNPTLDNDGNTLLTGALYWNTAVPEMRVWTGSAWTAVQSTSSSTAAATSATNAANSATAAAGSATTATTQATNASNSATAAASSASSATTQATNATNSATNAANSATAAAGSATAATAASTTATNAQIATENLYYAFDDRYLGDKVADPTTDNDGNVLLIGALYWNTVTPEMRVWSGTSWLAVQTTSAATAAASAAAAAAASYDSFDDRYLGAKASAPTLDNDGGTLLTGAMYWNSTTNQMNVWSGSVWNSLSTTISSSAITTALGYTPASNGANSDITSITSLDYVTFDTAAVPADAIGRLKWNSGEGTLDLGLKGGNVNLQIGQENVCLVYNNSGASIPNGSIVYITGSQGQRPTIALADADLEAASSKTLGVATETIANTAEGFITTLGIVRGLNTSTYTQGAALWLSQTAGAITTTKPVPPAHSVFIGYCINSHASSGTIFVSPQNGYELEELHDVKYTSLSNGDILQYNSTSLLWENKTIASLSLAALSSNNAFTGANTFYSATGQTFGTATTTNDAIIIAGRAGGTSSFRATIVPGTLTANKTYTLPDTAGTFAISTANNAFNGANTFYNATGQTFGTTTSTNDGIKIVGRAGGTSSYRSTLIPGTLTSNRTLTLPDNTGTLLTDTYINSWTGSASITTLGAVTATSVAVTNSTDTINSTSGVYSVTYQGNGFSVATQTTEPRGVCLSTDGTKLYILGNTGGTAVDSIIQYALSTAFDTTTAGTPVIFSVATQTTTPLDLYISPDGTMVFVINDVADSILKYTLSTPWDISTSVYSTSKSIATEETSAGAIYFKPDGTMMYVTGGSGDDINTYTLSTAWDITTATYSSASSISTYATDPQGLSFSPDGTKMWVVDGTYSRLIEYSLSTAWSVSTASFAGYTSVYLLGTTILGAVPSGLYIDTTANKVFITDYNSDRVIELSLNTPALMHTGTTLVADNDILIKRNATILSSIRCENNIYAGGSLYAGSAVANNFNPASSATSANYGSTITTGSPLICSGLTTGALVIGGTAQTGSITLGRSTSAQTIGIGVGAVTAATTKTINIGASGVATSITNINIGSEVSGSFSYIKVQGGIGEKKTALSSNDIDLRTGNVFTKTISSATTFTVSNIPTTGTVASFILELTNAAAYTITWFSGTKWEAGAAPQLTASGVDILGFYSHDGGTTWMGLLLAKDIK